MHFHVLVDLKKIYIYILYLFGSILFAKVMA
jgi:hypothetical protein